MLLISDARARSGVAGLSGSTVRATPFPSHIACRARAPESTWPYWVSSTQRLGRNDTCREHTLGLPAPLTGPLWCIEHPGCFWIPFCKLPSHIKVTLGIRELMRPSLAPQGELFFRSWVWIEPSEIWLFQIVRFPTLPFTLFIDHQQIFMNHLLLCLEQKFRGVT